MADRESTAIFYIDGERYRFKGMEVDELLNMVRDYTDTYEEAWEFTKQLGELFEERRRRREE